MAGCKCFKHVMNMDCIFLAPFSSLIFAFDQSFLFVYVKYISYCSKDPESNWLYLPQNILNKVYYGIIIKE